MLKLFPVDNSLAHSKLAARRRAPPSSSAFNLMSVQQWCKSRPSSHDHLILLFIWIRIEYVMISATHMKAGPPGGKCTKTGPSPVNQDSKSPQTSAWRKIEDEQALFWEIYGNSFAAQQHTVKHMFAFITASGIPSAQDQTTNSCPQSCKIGCSASSTDLLQCLLKRNFPTVEQLRWCMPVDVTHGESNTLEPDHFMHVN